MPHLNKENINNCPEEIGVYRVFAHNAEGLPIPIARLAGPDTTGLLYVGRTTAQNLKKRLHNFWMTSRLDLNTHNHSGALKYRLNTIIRNTLGANHSLIFEFEICTDPKQRERQLLNEYAAIYGEYPPLNG